VLGVREISGKPSAARIRPLPAIALYGDRRLIVPDSPEGALQHATVYPLTDERFRQVYADAHSAGLAIAHDYGDSTVQDGGVVVFTLGTADGPVITRAAKVGGNDEARRLERFRAGLTPATWPSSALAARPYPYEPERLAAIATMTGTAGPDVRPWPTDPLTGAQTVDGYCGIVEGPQIAEVTALARGATAATRWSNGGRVFQLDFRPLLPHETDCQSLGK